MVSDSVNELSSVICLEMDPEAEVVMEEGEPVMRAKGY